MSGVSLIFSICALIVSTFAWCSVLHLRHSVRYAWNCKDQGHCYVARYSEAFDRHVFDELLKGAYLTSNQQKIPRLCTVRVYEGEVCRVCGDKKDK